jgi:hypothetical protein
VNEVSVKKGYWNNGFTEQEIGFAEMMGRLCKR